MAEDFGDPIEPVLESEKNTDNTKKIIIIVVIVLAVLCLCACIVFFVAPALLGPTIENVFSDVVQGIEAP